MLLKSLYDIGRLLVIIVKFIIGFVSDLVELIKTVVQAFEYLPEFFSWVPISLGTLLTSLFIVVILYKVLGREG